MKEVIFAFVVFEKTIYDLLEENYVYARALHYLGIDFFVIPHKKLSEVCLERNLDRNTVIRTFYLFDTQSRVSYKELESYPIEILTEYLKHNHHSFIKEKLPFIVHLVKRSSPEVSLAHLLPEFIEDFIKHIYEEEDTVFRYVEILLKIKRNQFQSPSKVLYKFRELSLGAEAVVHSNDDDFAAIRSLVDNFKPQDLNDQVLLKEIKAFDRELTYHSQIENQLFFPKAIALEDAVFSQLKKLS